MPDEGSRSTRKAVTAVCMPSGGSQMPDEGSRGFLEKGRRDCPDEGSRDCLESPDTAS